VNGTAAIIDADYTLLDISWTMSSCIDLFPNIDIDLFPNIDYEGVQVSGFAMEIVSPTGAPGSYLFILTGRAQDRVFSISVGYDRI
jgi:hypothetical protein